jgi:hypothetical protein
MDIHPSRTLPGLLPGLIGPYSQPPSVKMSYASLADEIIVQIVKLVRPADVENFALIDVRTYRISYERLVERRALKRNAKVMSTRFGSPRCPIGWYTPDTFSQRPEFGEKYDLSREGATADLDYLELHGDLHWLQPLDDETAESHKWFRGQCASKETLDALVVSAQRVGVEFPEAFLKLMGSTELMERMYLGGDYFSLGPSLVKCNPEDDREGGGYVIRFLSDQQGVRYWALYVAPGGYHCVLDGHNDVHCWECGEEMQYEDHPKYVHEGIPVACEKLDITLVNPSFESWLAMEYFDRWYSGTLYNGHALTERQTEYLDHIWPKKARSENTSTTDSLTLS